MSSLKAGQALRGAKDTYFILKQINETIWTARTAKSQNVVVKTAPPSRLRREHDTLQRFANHKSIRQLVESIDEPPCLILEHLECDALEASSESRLSRSYVKLIAKKVLEALQALHARGLAHTDVKPDNVLLNFGEGGAGVADVKLADCGDAWQVGNETNPKGEGHIIGAAIFRSPEAMLQLRWATPTDIWSFGATLISFLWGRHFHIFKPKGFSIDDEAYATQVLVQQVRFFGPVPVSYEDFIDADQNEALAMIMSHIEEQKSRKPFQLLQDKEVTAADKVFLCKVMRMDPRDRPTAKQLLGDEWFDEL